MFTMEITRLIERCRQGDADALGELYKAYAQQMRGVCRRYISDEQTVEDVLHAFVIIFFTPFDRLRDVRRAEPWMTAITRNVASKCGRIIWRHCQRFRSKRRARRTDCRRGRGKGREGCAAERGGGENDRQTAAGGVGAGVPAVGVRGHDAQGDCRHAGH